MKTFDPRGPLDPRTDPARWETVVRAIVRAATPQLELLAARRPALPLVALAHWFRPVLAAATVVLVLAIAALTSRPSDAAETWGVAEVIAPEPVAAWLLVGIVPTAEEIMTALEEAGR